MTLFKGAPAESPMLMPAQNLSKQEKVSYLWQGWRPLMARIITFGGALALSIYATHQMVLIVSQGAVTPLQWGLVALFCITFVWIAVAACAAVSGFFFSGKSRPRQPVDLSRQKTVLLMPSYNEDPSQTCAALYSMGNALAQQGLSNQFEIFIISDSNNPEVVVKEVAAVHKLQSALDGKMKVWYRRRHDNKAKKAGNVHDFVSRWGARYDYMIVLDADSLLTATTLHEMMQAMASDDKSGIIQTLPMLYRGDTLFARLQQFAGTIYGPIVARGVSAWQGHDGNYWGHNAIIRVKAFAESAGLPKLGGIKPFEGDILSHDFVEAALIRRAGWSVYMLPDLQGSWEESPPSISDVAVRDRRWAQGNIQHLAVLKAKGLRWPNRFHMLTGVMAYMASPFWLALILIGILMGIQAHYATVEYFGDQISLIPNWPVFDSARMVDLFVFTMGILLIPKALGLIIAIFNARLRKPLGIIRMCLGTVVELVFSVLYAPIFMLIHSKHIVDIFRGRDSGWATQQRQSSGIPWASVAKQHFWHTVIGIVMTLVMYYYSPLLLVWLSPIVVGLIFAIPLSALSASKGLASILRYLGILNIPVEVTTVAEIETRDKFAKELEATLGSVTLEGLLNDDTLSAQHFSMVMPLPKTVKGEAPVHKLSAAYKINDAVNSDEAIRWLSKPERLCVLSDTGLFEQLRNVHDESSANLGQGVGA